MEFVVGLLLVSGWDCYEPSRTIHLVVKSLNGIHVYVHKEEVPHMTPQENTFSSVSENAWNASVCGHDSALDAGGVNNSCCTNSGTVAGNT
jgi:hypothetical protein